LNDAAASNIIYNDNIDILIDLSGHTSKNRLSLFSYKPAPVQASWLGYFASTGMKEIDYFIADQYTIPTNIEEGYFREKILKLPDSYLCFTEPKFDVNVSDLPSLVNNYITFGCLNNITKVNDDVIKLWSTILNSVVNSKLFLKSMQLNDESFCDIVRNKFIKHGVDGDRLILEAFSPRIDILRTYQKIDIALDPFPYPGGTTSVEALWMGVPLLTKIGSNFLSRLGESLMMNVSMPEWIAQDDEDYVKKAIEHSSSIDKLREIRMGLRQKAISSPLFDSKRFARNFEDAMFKIWNDKLKEKGIV
jgi:predicted O-linked N-acetylglucosamine transferase (SPINDLY family)